MCAGAGADGCGIEKRGSERTKEWGRPRRAPRGRQRVPGQVPAGRARSRQDRTSRAAARPGARGQRPQHADALACLQTSSLRGTRPSSADKGPAPASLGADRPHSLAVGIAWAEADLSSRLTRFIFSLADRTAGSEWMTAPPWSCALLSEAAGRLPGLPWPRPPCRPALGSPRPPGRTGQKAAPGGPATGTARSTGRRPCSYELRNGPQAPRGGILTCGVKGSPRGFSV